MIGGVIISGSPSDTSRTTPSSSLDNAVHTCHRRCEEDGSKCICVHVAGAEQNVVDISDQEWFLLDTRLLQDGHEVLQYPELLRSEDAGVRNEIIVDDTEVSTPILDNSVELFQVWRKCGITCACTPG